MENAPSSLIWAANSRIGIAALVALLMLMALLAWAHWRSNVAWKVLLPMMLLKTVGLLILLICVLEPLVSSRHARPGANIFVVLADNSQSMTLRDRGAQQTRAQQLQSVVQPSAKWLEQIRSDFDLRQYSFDSQLHAQDRLDKLEFDGKASDLGASLDQLFKRYQGKPLAGVILLTDGNATDVEATERVISQLSSNGSGSKTPPIYPVMLGSENIPDDINLEQVAVTQTNFEDAPVTVSARISTSGFKGKSIVAQVQDESGKTLQRQTLRVDDEARPMNARFQLRPDHQGITFYRVAVSSDRLRASGDPSTTAPADADQEATLANNDRLIAVDRGQGPYRVLYVSGRPNWEYKFLARSVVEDTQLQLSALIRVAKREPRFNFLGYSGSGADAANPLFRGFDNKKEEQTEQYDQPVVKPITDDAKIAVLLASGFPKNPVDLYQFDAVVLDDVESTFFSQDQMQLLKEFVRYRGGGLLMLGGQESFKNGNYDRSVIGDLLPVYVDQAPAIPEGARFRMALSREGWLEPWVRLRTETAGENDRLAAMPEFATLNPVRGIKPGATVLASAEMQSGGSLPALVQQRFGKGRVAALLIGDLWRWDMHRPANTTSDLQKAWRQVVRWLVAEVPHRLEVAITPLHGADDPADALDLSVRVREAGFAPLDNARVTIQVTGADGKPIDLTAEPSEKRGRALSRRVCAAATRRLSRQCRRGRAGWN